MNLWIVQGNSAQERLLFLVEVIDDTMGLDSTTKGEQ
jgi:hypothetical protein